MPFTVQPLFAPTQLPAAAAVLFTATARTTIQKLTVHNPSDTTPYDVTLYWVPALGMPAAANTIETTREVLPLEAWDVWSLIGHTLATGDALYGVASVADVLNIFGSGVLMS